MHRGDVRMLYSRWLLSEVIILIFVKSSYIISNSKEALPAVYIYLPRTLTTGSRKKKKDDEYNVMSCNHHQFLSVKPNGDIRQEPPLFSAPEHQPFTTTTPRPFKVRHRLSALGTMRLH